MEKMEKVETLRNKAGVTYEEAKAALEANSWDVLDTMIALEKEGKVKQAYTSTKAEVLTGDVVTDENQKRSSEPKRRKFINVVGTGPFATAIAHCHGVEPMGDGRGKRIVPAALLQNLHSYDYRSR